jgi:hypothetical protein
LPRDVGRRRLKSRYFFDRNSKAERNVVGVGVVESDRAAVGSVVVLVRRREVQRDQLARRAARDYSLGSSFEEFGFVRPIFRRDGRKGGGSRTVCDAFSNFTFSDESSVSIPRPPSAAESVNVVAESELPEGELNH